MEEYTQGINYFIKLIIKWRKHFIITTIAAIIISVVFSSATFIKPKYKSFAIVYPSNLFPYSSESKSEQMMQLFESADIRNSVIQKFDLSKHYGINTDSPTGVSELIAEYESNVSVTRTDYESILIKVMDTDRELACKMVKEIINALNLKARTLQREKSMEVLAMQQNQLRQKRVMLDSINNSIQSLRINYQLLDYETQVKEFTKGYIKQLTGSKNNIKDVDIMIRNLQQKGGEFYTLTRTYDLLLDSYNTVQLEYDNTIKDLDKELTYTSEITSPIVADKKSYPVRWLIVLVSVLCANLFLLVILLMSEKKLLSN